MHAGLIISTNIYVKGAKWWKSVNAYYNVNNDNYLPWKKFIREQAINRKTKFSLDVYCFISDVPIYGTTEKHSLSNFQCAVIVDYFYI